MSSAQIIQVVSAHAEGEVGDVITAGVAPPPGKTVWEQSRWLAQDQSLRNLMLNEPRGGVFRHVNLLVPPDDPNADAAFIIMEPEDTPPMSGSNSMCVATVLLETGIIEMQEPVTEITLQAPGGLVRVKADCMDGKATRITIENLPSFACEIDADLEVSGIGTIKVDTAFGGDSFAIVDAHSMGFGIKPDEARDLARVGMQITNAANDQLGFQHPMITNWKHISFCNFATRVVDGVTRSAVAIQPGKIDRSPTGTGVCARMAVLVARGEMDVGDQLCVRSILDSQFTGRITGRTKLGSIPAIVPEISGQAWITGHHQHIVDSTDPWPEGYRLNDTWGVGP